LQSSKKVTWNNPTEQENVWGMVLITPYKSDYPSWANASLLTKCLMLKDWLIDANEVKMHGGTNKNLFFFPFTLFSFHNQQSSHLNNDDER